jgi:hypothetical protein
VEALDILSTLPWVLRQVIKAFIAQPFFYVFVDRVTARIECVESGVVEEVEGVMLHEIMFLNKGGMEATAWREAEESGSGAEPQEGGSKPEEEGSKPEPAA